MEKMYIQRPPLGLERRCFLQNLFSRIVLNLRQKPHLSDKQTHLSSFQCYCRAHMSTLLSFYLSAQPLFDHLVPYRRGQLRGIKTPPQERGLSQWNSLQTSRGIFQPPVSLCSRLHQVCRQPPLSSISLIVTAPSFFFRSANDLPFASPTFPKVCLSELLADPCCQHVVLKD